jgi:hypothetical protein
MGSADLPVLVILSRHAATFLPPNWLTDKILQRHAILRLQMVSSEQRDAYDDSVRSND